MPVGRPSGQAIFEDLNRAVWELYNVGGLPRPEEAEEIWEGIWYEETHHSTAIEGNTLILKEVKTLLDEGRAVGDKEFREYLEVQGYAEAAQWVYGHGRNPAWDHETLISLSELREIHERAVAPVWRHFPPMDHDKAEGPGSFRRHDIEPFAEGMKPPAWPDVPPLVTDWIAAMNEMELESPGDLVMQLADLHAAFERIHPFRDGNGRAGRVALNLALVRVGYPPVIIYKKDRMKYLRGLDRADNGDAGPLAELLARSVKYGIDRFLLPALAGPLRMIPISALADEEMSLIALRRAAERGRLKASRRVDQWYSTRKWVEEYKESRQRGRRRQPPPRKAGRQVPATPTPTAPAAPPVLLQEELPLR